MMVKLLVLEMEEREGVGEEDDGSGGWWWSLPEVGGVITDMVVVAPNLRDKEKLE